MSDDMTLSCGNGFVNIRVGAIILKDGKFLMASDKHFDYYYSVGGRIKFGETAEQAVVREVYEETGTKMKAERLGFVHENYFYCDTPDKNGKTMYELCFYFYMNVPDDFELIKDNFNEGDNILRLELISPDHNGKIYPEFFRTELSSPCDTVKHIVTDQR